MDSMNAPVRSLYIAIPSYSGHIHAFTMQTVIEAINDLSRERWLVAVCMVIKDARLAMVRNRLLANFLHSGSSDMLMLDDDVSAPGGSSAIHRLMQHPVDFACGIYPSRHHEPPPVRWLEDSAGQRLTQRCPETGLIDVEGAGAGFMRISRACAAQMVTRYQVERYDDKEALSGVAWRLFNEPIKGDAWGEDYMFCKRWRAIGGKVWVDPDLVLTHSGETSWTASLSQYLEQHEKGKAVAGAAQLIEA